MRGREAGQADHSRDSRGPVNSQLAARKAGSTMKFSVEVETSSVLTPTLVRKTPAAPKLSWDIEVKVQQEVLPAPEVPRAAADVLTQQSDLTRLETIQQKEVVKTESTKQRKEAVVTLVDIPTARPASPIPLLCQDHPRKHSASTTSKNSCEM